MYSSEFRSSEIIRLLDSFTLEPLSEEVQDLYKSARENMFTNPEEALELFHKALFNLEKSSQIAFDSSEIFAYSRGKIHFLIASIHLDHKNLEEAEAHYFCSKDEFHSRQWNHLVSLTYWGLAITLRLLGRIREAYDACLEAQVNISYESVPSRINTTDLCKAIEKEIGEIQELLVCEDIETISERSTQTYSQQVPQFVWEIPVVSHIAAGLGHPIAQENIEDYKELREGKSEGSENYFIVVVDGDSMAGDGISSGDGMLIRQQEGAKNKDIAAVVINTPGTEPIGVLKRYYVVSEEDEAMRHWLLESSNPSSEHLVVMPEGADVKAIQARYGKVPGRKFEFYENAELSIAGVFVKVVEKV